MWLALSILYLWLRRFDFSVLFRQIRLSGWVPLQAVIAFAAGGLAMDAYTYGSYYASEYLQPTMTPSLLQTLQQADISLILYALLNGFHEEFFFLGLCLAVKPQHVKWAFLYSLLVRISFHTYQGLGGAIALGLLLGTVFFILYRVFKPKNLLPFFLAHAFADIVGLTLLSHILY